MFHWVDEKVPVVERKELFALRVVGDHHGFLKWIRERKVELNESSSVEIQCKS